MVPMNIRLSTALKSELRMSMEMMLKRSATAHLLKNNKHGI